MSDRDGTPQFKLRLRDRDIWLGAGRYVVGRGSTCHVIIDDGLASRRHAELTIRPGSAVIRDLGSINGVFIDGVRVGDQPEPLLPGCRIVIGNEVLHVGAGSPPLPRAAADTLTGEEPVVPGGDDEEEVTVRTLSSVLPQAREGRGAALRIEPTQRVDAVVMFAPIALEAIRGGRGADAEQLVGVHLRSVLAGAKGGISPKPETLARTIDLALELALTGRAGWVDFVVDLLDTLRMPPSSREMMDRFEKAAQKAGSIDVERLTRWARMLRQRIATLDIQDLERLDRIEGLVATFVRAR